MYIFLQDDYNGDVLVAKDDWFETMPLCQSYDSYGQKVECNNDYAEDCDCPQVRVYNYWNGSNHQSVIISQEVDSRYCQITDQAEIHRYIEAIENKEFIGETTGVKTYSFENLLIRKSIWCGDWEIFSIKEKEI